VQSLQVAACSIRTPADSRSLVPGSCDIVAALILVFVAWTVCGLAPNRASAGDAMVDGDAIQGYLFRLEKHGEPVPAPITEATIEVPV
jgi:hypothetical protein